MAYADEAANVAIAMLPYVRKTMTDDQVDMAVSSADANEGYVSLTWTLDFADDDRVQVPSELLKKAYALLDDEDKPDYAWLKAKLSA